MDELKKINDFTWEIPSVDGMTVPGRIFASEELLGNIKSGKSLEQVKNVAMLPGIIGASLAMPDCHQGYGYAIGGVSAMDLEKGVICPGGVGYDINCSVRLLRTNLKSKDLKCKEEEILNALFKVVPTGTGNRGSLEISEKELDSILVKGASWMVEKGYGESEDLDFIEENGCLEGALATNVSKRAKERGLPQLGSLGAGNHFLDILVVSEVFDSSVAKVYGLELDQVVILIHCGSRGLGHQVASDYIALMDKEYGHPEFDRGLVHAPIKSELGKKYLSAMNAAANFAFANKQLITHNVRETMKEFFPGFSANVVYDICHNIAKVEKHGARDVLITRKGATRSFGPGNLEIVEKYREVGCPVIIPGSMGTSSYVLSGTKKAEEISFGSTAHGAGRDKSRTAAREIMDYETAKEKMKDLSVFVKSGSHKGMIEEAPGSYKDVSEVVRVSHELGIGKKVVRLDPKIVVIG